MFPLVGDIYVAQKDLFAFRDELQKKLSKYLVEPQVMVSISSIKSQKIMVLGEVNNPGIYTLDTNVSLVEAITNAGSTTDGAKLSNVALVRKVKDKSEIIAIDIEKAFKKGDISKDIMLQNGDIVYIPEVKISSTSRFFSYISKILSPIVQLGSGIVMWDQAIDIFGGKNGEETSLAITP